MDGENLSSGVNASINGARYDPAALQARSDQVVAVAAAFLTLGWVAVAMRVYVRGILLRNFRAEDFLTAFTMVLFSVFCILLVVITSTNAGVQGSDINLSGLPNIPTALVTAVAFYIVTMIFFKIALGIFYLRIVCAKWQKYVVWAVMATSTGYGLVFLFVVLFQCGSPTDLLVKMYQGKCLPIDTVLNVALVGGIVNAVTDWVLALLPISIVQKANLDRRTKVNTAAILLLAVTGSVASVVRLFYIKGLVPGPNFFWATTNAGIWTTVEPGLGIIAACLATLRPLYQKLAGTRESPYTSRSNTLIEPLGKKRFSRKDVVEIPSWDSYMEPRFDHQLRPYEDIESGTSTNHKRDASQSSSEQSLKGSNKSGYSLNSTQALPRIPEPTRPPTTASMRMFP